MSTKITEDVKVAINATIKESSLTASLFAQKYKIAPSMLSRWLHGGCNSINNSSWELIYPAIKKFLPEDFCDIPKDKPDKTIAENLLDKSIIAYVKTLSFSEKLIILQQIEKFKSSK